MFEFQEQARKREGERERESHTKKGFQEMYNLPPVTSNQHTHCFKNYRNKLIKHLNLCFQETPAHVGQSL